MNSVNSSANGSIWPIDWRKMTQMVEYMLYMQNNNNNNKTIHNNNTSNSYNNINTTQL